MSVRAHTRAQSSEQRIGHRLNEQVIALEAVKINGASHSSVASNARGSQPSSEFCRPLLSLPLNNFRDEKAVWRSRWGFSRHASLTLLALDNYSFSYAPLFRTFPPIEICSGEPVQGGESARHLCLLVLCIGSLKITRSSVAGYARGRAPLTRINWSPLFGSYVNEVKHSFSHSLVWIMRHPLRHQPADALN